MNLIFFAHTSLVNNNVQQQNLLFISGKKHKILRHFAQESWRSELSLGEDDRYTDESKDILNLILNDDASTDSDGDVEEL